MSSGHDLNACCKPACCAVEAEKVLLRTSVDKEEGPELSLLTLSTCRPPLPAPATPRRHHRQPAAECRSQVWGAQLRQRPLSHAMHAADAASFAVTDKLQHGYVLE
jgi:hypothetical protein